MKKLLLILLLFPIKSFAVSGECHHQSNPLGYTNYDVCEVAGTGYTCVSLEGKASSGISCFPTLVAQEEEEYQEKSPTVKRKNGFSDRKIGEN